MIAIQSIRNSNNVVKLKNKMPVQTAFTSNTNQQDTVDLSNPQKKSKKGLMISLAAIALGVGAILLFRKKGAVDATKKAVTNLVENVPISSGEVAKDVPAYHLKTARECITKLFGEIPTEKEALEKFVKTPYEAMGHKMPTLPLEVAAHYGDNNLVKLFLAHGADINNAGVSKETALHAATKKGHLDTVKLLLDNGADMNAVYNPTYRSETIYSAGRDAHAIDLAAENGHNDLIEFFISKGVEVKRIDHFGDTPLSLAAKNGHAKTVESLIKKGLDVNTPDGILQTALHKSARGGSIDVVDLLLKNGADVKLKDDCGRIPLFHAIENGHKDTAEILLKNGSELNSVDECGKTLLHSCAGLHGNKDMVEFVLNKGVDINALSHTKNTPLDVAISFKREEIIDLLKSKGAKTGKELENISK